MDINGYELLDLIGEGPLTEIWRARHLTLDRLVAVRALKPEAAADPDEVALFLQEARLAAEIQHPHVVQIYDVGQAGDRPYFIMEYVAGRTLEQMLDDGETFTPERALPIAEAVGSALAAAWEKSRMIHRNIKPANIRIDDDGSIKLKYLGLSMRTEPGGSSPDRIEGTPNYMAPEQAQGLSLDCRADMYGLGATLYHMLTGHVPFGSAEPEEAMRLQIEEQLPNPRDLNADLSHGLAVFIAKLMMKDPADRYADWSQALNAMKAVARGHIMLDRSGGSDKSTVAPPGAKAAPLRKVTRRPRPSPRNARPGVKVRAKPRMQPLSRPAAAAPKQAPPADASAAQPARHVNRPPTSAPPAPRRRKASRSREIAAAYGHGPSIPMPVHLIAWTVVLAWWAFLGFNLHAPLRVPSRSSIPPATTIPSNQAPPAAQPSRPAAATPPALTAEQQADLQTLAQRAASSLLNLHGRDARRPVQLALGRSSQGPYHDALQQLDAVLRQLLDPHTRTAAALAPHIGEEIAIHIGDMQRSIIPRAIVNEEIRADLIKESGGQRTASEVTLSVREIHPADRAAWITPVQSPADAALKAALLMNAGRHADARAAASQAGPLSEALTQAIDAQRDG